MYKTSYVCDCCGAEMTPLPWYTLSLSTQSLCIQDQVTWHYCEDCWKDVKKALTKKNESNNLEKVVEELKEENKKLKKDAKWYEQFFMSIYMAFMNNLFGKQTGYGFTTTSSKEKTADDESSVGCYCENSDKNLNYKWAWEI